MKEYTMETTTQLPVKTYSKSQLDDQYVFYDLKTFQSTINEKSSNENIYSTYVSESDY